MEVSLLGQKIIFTLFLFAVTYILFYVAQQERKREAYNFYIIGITYGLMFLVMFLMMLFSCIFG